MPADGAVEAEPVSVVCEVMAKLLHPFRPGSGVLDDEVTKEVAGELVRAGRDELVVPGRLLPGLT
jgi:hypothetical protein